MEFSTRSQALSPERAETPPMFRGRNCVGARNHRERGIVSTIDHPLIERLRTSRAPVADLVGFSIEPLGDGMALGWLDAGP
jgi:hypothetical protein